MASLPGVTRRLAAAAVLGALLVPTPTAAAAQTIGYPTFNGPAVPAPPVGVSTGHTTQAIFDAESGGTDFWMDRLPARSRHDPPGTWLMTRGRGPTTMRVWLPASPP